jgi:hypothetical protein
MLDKTYPPVKLWEELPDGLKLQKVKINNKRCTFKEMQADFSLDSFYRY